MSGRVPGAVTVWNELVEHGVIQSGTLDPARGESIADPVFRFGIQPDPRVFGWHVTEIPGVFVSTASGSLDLDISGDEPSSFSLLSVNAPVTGGARYQLVWKVDASQLNSPHDPGFAFQIEQQPGKGMTMCPPLLVANPPACEFTAASDTGMVAIRLMYTRAQGTVRVSGMLHLHSVRLEIAK